MAVVVVSRRGADAVRRGHPWIYRSAMAQKSSSRSINLRASETARSITVGALSEIADEEGVILGSGVIDPVGPLAVRVWSASPRHVLGPDLFRERLERALEVRRVLFESPRGGRTTAYRILNGEGDRTPGVVVDRYGSVAVLRIDIPNTKRNNLNLFNY